MVSRRAPSSQEHHDICQLKLMVRRSPSTDKMPGLTSSPPFPDDVPTHPLLVIDYQLVLAGDEEEMEKLWKAATELGFW